MYTFVGARSNQFMSLKYPCSAKDTSTSQVAPSTQITKFPCSAPQGGRRFLSQSQSIPKNITWWGQHNTGRKRSDTFWHHQWKHAIHRSSPPFIGIPRIPKVIWAKATLRAQLFALRSKGGKAACSTRRAWLSTSHFFGIYWWWDLTGCKIGVYDGMNVNRYPQLCHLTGGKYGTWPTGGDHRCHVCWIKWGTAFVKTDEDEGICKKGIPRIPQNLTMRWINMFFNTIASSIPTLMLILQERHL